ncbi:MAG: hypothetical protein WDN28_19250 [Chthoniobacter sp.]
MPDWKIRRAPTIQTELEVPGDKSISHRAVMLAAMSNGTCVIRGFLASEDCLCTVAAIRALASKSRMRMKRRSSSTASAAPSPPPGRISTAAIPAPPCASWPAFWQGSHFAAA